MRITRDNITNALERAEVLLDALETFKDAAQAWLDFQEEPRTAENREDIATTREELEEALTSVEDMLA